ncbi:MAG: hypothetical protein M1813_000974 [Trichoglossum hirsutum]|nr:MAG: hypothetical protein M1813_000974 [Trichoglossum hirsutum]
MPLGLAAARDLWRGPLLSFLPSLALYLSNSRRSYLELSKPTNRTRDKFLLKLPKWAKATVPLLRYDSDNYDGFSEELDDYSQRNYMVHNSAAGSRPHGKNTTEGPKQNTLERPKNPPTMKATSEPTTTKNSEKRDWRNGKYSTLLKELQEKHDYSIFEYPGYKNTHFAMAQHYYCQDRRPGNTGVLGNTGCPSNHSAHCASEWYWLMTRCYPTAYLSPLAPGPSS